MPRRSLLLIALLLVGFVLQAGCREAVPERPRDPWVFRSVLDGRPRMITLALHDDLWAAYSTETAALYKVWEDGVDLEGAVYNTTHGPQPTTRGDAYLLSPYRTPWVVTRAGREVQPEVQYRGHRFVDGRAVLQYELQLDDGAVIRIKERPEYVRDDAGRPGFERVFTAGEMPEDLDVALQMHLHSMPSAESYETNGRFEAGPATQMTIEGREVFTRDGRLTLNADDETRFTTWFHEAPMILTDTPDAGAEEVHPGLALIEQSDCQACHNAEVQTVGPAYVAVAERYAPTEENMAMLVDKIIRGGGGNWTEAVGGAVMTPHETLAPEDARQMVDYILSLGGAGKAAAEAAAQEEEAPRRNGLLDKGESYALLDFIEDAENDRGLVANIYRFDDTVEEMPTPAPEEKPTYSGVVPALHAPGFNAFRELVHHFYVEARGFIEIPRTDNYVFRLVSDDGASLHIDDRVVIDDGAAHRLRPSDGEVYLEEGRHPIVVRYYQNRGRRALSLQWAPHGADDFTVVPPEVFRYDPADLKETAPYVPPEPLIVGIPGDGRTLIDVHPAFDLETIRPSDFEPKVGGLDVFPDGRVAVSTWDPDGSVYLLRNLDAGDREQIEVQRIAAGLAEPLGLKIVDGDIYVMQKHELTRLIDHDGDAIIDEYRTVANDWGVTANFHEFAFGLAYEEGYFYATLATAIQPGGASAQPQHPDRGSVLKISRAEGTVERLANGLRTPNGIGHGTDGHLYVADNQGDWLPANKIVRVQPGAWYGSRSVDFEGTEGLAPTPPVVWLPHGEIANSPSQPAPLNVGPYQNQIVYGDVTHGGLKRVFVEEVDGQYQGAVFRFMQGLEAGVNRIAWGPEGRLYVGGIGNPGNWSDSGKHWYGLQRLTYNGNTAFEMLAVRARTNGLEITFTEPLQVNDGFERDDYRVRQWWYKPTANYGGPKMDEETLPVRSVHVSEDRRRVFLEVDGMKPGHVVYLRLQEPFISQAGHELWTTEAWYTLNRIPANQPGFTSALAYEPARPNTLTSAERAAGWRLLFDGRTIDGWHGYGQEGVPTVWQVEDGALTYVPGGARGDLVTDDEFEDFELRLDWKISPGGNSGLFYNVVESEAYPRIWHTGQEMQVLDNERHPDGRKDRRRAGDLYDLVASRYVAARPVGAWNEVRILQRDGHVEHWLNGHRVLQYTIGTDAWKERVAESKFADLPGYGRAARGRLALQDHRNRVWYRNIKVRPLDAGQ